VALFAANSPLNLAVSVLVFSSRKQMREEYDFSRGERGKYARRYAQGTNVVVLEPDVAKVFSNSKVVNVSLRKIIRQQARQLVK
jgi:hypothetical protein